MTEPAFATTTLAIAPNEHIVLDELPGRAPAWLYLHGFGSARKGEKSTALFLHAARQHRAAVRFDMRGHGDASGELGSVTFTEQLADAATVLDRTGPAVLVGSSLGGLVAIHLAASRPADVRALLLLAPAMGFLPRLRSWLDPDRRMKTGDGRVVTMHERALADAADHDERDLPAQLSMPVFIAHGTGDEVVPWQLSENLAAAIPHAQKTLWLLPGADHRLNLEFEAILARADAMFAQCGVA